MALGVAQILLLSDGRSGGSLSVLVNGRARRLGVTLVLILVLDDGIVRDQSSLTLDGGFPGEEQRTEDKHPPLDRVIPPDNASLHEGDEEDSRQDGDTSTATHGHGGNVPGRLLAQTQTGGALVHNGQSANGGRDKEPKGRRVDGPRNRVATHVHNHLDEHEDDGTEAARDDRGHTQTSKDGTQTLTLVPSPLDLRGTDSGHTHTSHGRDKRVGRRDVSRVAGTPHHPGRSGSQGTSEGHHLDTGVVVEGRAGDDAVLDRVSRAGTDGDGAQEFEDGA